ncbi:nucleoside triphosphate hydrolase [Corynebacterium sp. TAE3-ERU12]|uniref:MazG nucleotide pyrophosphohydrolase domain-containing protein n=1 Tax=Corynebacterium sp. TAE3-ERU12 TaxID=2849491 RepID=UPI001C43CDCB|nr:MazG nucleotide pyrophosphohydrolase domain-containing protein [Corynebacterium sp. TAE3-ERU12]MBV7295691.1 nucleoside triphosphate hydrolase [Corynebacterium sp. TAE3-ERU12]
MAIIELDPRYPNAIPIPAFDLIGGDICYTDEVPISVRWAIADQGGHSVSEAEVLVTTDQSDYRVQERLRRGEKLYAVGTNHLVEPQPPVEQKLPQVIAAVELMHQARARGEWEASQTHRSLLPYLVEETYEFVDAVNEDGDIKAELADVLLQVLFHAEIGDGFDIDDVAESFVSKLQKRMPYLFDGSEGQVSVEEQKEAWEAGRSGDRSEPAQHLPALALAAETIRRARAAGIADSELPEDLVRPNPEQEDAEERTRAAAREVIARLCADEQQ